MTITVISQDPLIGADTDGLYDGTWVEIGYDELTVTTTEVEGGFERTTTYGDELISKGNLTRDGFLNAYLAGHPNADDGEQEAAWQAEINITAHAKLWTNTMIDGEYTVVEQKLKRIEWVRR